MKFKYCFVLAVILIILFSFASVAANENDTQIESFEDDALSLQGTDEIQDDLNVNPPSSDEQVDVSVKLDVENVYVGNKYNQAGSDVPWIVTVNVTGGTAKNTKVYEKLSENMQYVSHNSTIGTFNPETGIWDIGDLNSADNATLTIVTKLLANGRFKNTVNATTDSIDVDLSNNVCTLPIRSGTGKSTGNTTETTDDKSGAQHSDHLGSAVGSGFLQRDGEKSSDEGSDSKSTRDKAKSSKDSASKTDDDKNTVPSSTKSTLSVTNILSNELSSSLSNILDPNSNSSDEDSKDNSLNSHEGAIITQDYTKVPILVLSLFLIVLLAVGVYSKIKS